MMLKFAAVCFLLSLASAQIPDYPWDEVTILDEYVNRDDGVYSWTILDTYAYEGVNIYMLNMTSQRYLTDAVVSRSLWWHVMGVAIPVNVQSFDTALVFNAGGSNENEGYPNATDFFNMAAVLFTNQTGMVSSYILNNPNQPCLFYDDPEQRLRSEDHFIAYTWWWILNQTTKGETPSSFDIVARNPMTKASKRANDATAELVKQVDARFDINKIVSVGWSKRGWTAWSTAAVDPRVIAVIPMSCSLLYFEETLMGQFQAMDGAWSWPWAPYYMQNLSYSIGTEYATVIYDIEDPFRYRTRLSGIPKYLVAATGDEFYLNQDTLYWWDQMGGDKWLLMNANAEHTLLPYWEKIFYSTMCWTYQLVFHGVDTLPTVTWNMEQLAGSAQITLSTTQVPETALGFEATTPLNGTTGSARRDFRLVAGHPEHYTQPIFWSNSSAEQIDGLTYRVTVPTPTENEVWSAFFVETQYQSAYFDRTMYFTSQVLPTPNTFPSERCTGGVSCYGSLV